MYKAIFHCLDGTTQEMEDSSSDKFKEKISAGLQATGDNKKPKYEKVQLFLPVDILEVLLMIFIL